MEHIDGNLEALKRYEEHIDAEDARYETFLAALESEVLPLYEEALAAFKALQKLYGYSDTDQDFCSEMSNI